MPIDPAAVKIGSTGRRWLWRGAVVVALLAMAWTIGIGGWLPRVLQPRIEAAGTEALGAPLAIGSLEIAPWTLQVRVSDLRLGPAERPWLSVAAIEAEIAAESLWRLAPVLERLHVQAPRVELERHADGRFNVQPMVEALVRRPPPPPDAEPGRFALHNITLTEGALRLVDRISASEHRVEGLRVGVPFVSNLPSHVTVDVEPLLDASIDGSRFHAQGRTLPFTQGQRSEIDVRWEAIDVAAAYQAAARLLPRALPLTLHEARLDLALRLVFERRAAPAQPSLQISGRAALAPLRAELPPHGAALAWERLEVEGIDAHPLERRVALGRVALQAPALDIDLPRLLAGAAVSDADGAAPGPSQARPAAAPAPAASSAGTTGAAAAGAWQWRLENLSVAGGRALLRHPAWPAGQALGSIEATVTGLSGHEATPAPLELGLVDARGARVHARGEVVLATPRAALELDVSGLDTVAWSTPWQALLPVRLLAGRADVTARAEADVSRWAVRDGTVQLTDVALAPAGRTAPATQPRGSVDDDRLSIPQATVSGIEVEGAAGQAPSTTVAAVRLERLALAASRGAFGLLPWWQRAAPAAPAVRDPHPARDPQPAGASAAAAVTPATPGAAPRWTVGELRCSACNVRLVDRSLESAPTLTMSGVELGLRKLGSDFTRPFDVGLAAQVGPTGRAQLRGALQLQPLVLRSRVDLAQMDLSLLRDYLQPYVNFTLASVAAEAAGDLLVQGSAEQTVTEARWQGRLGVTGLRTFDRVNDDDFLSLRRLQLDGADLRWRPQGIEADLGTVDVEGFAGRVILNSNGRLNLRDLARRPGDDAEVSLTTPTEAAPGAAAAPKAASAPAPQDAASAPLAGRSATPALRWRAIRIADAAVDFTDNFIRPSYSANLRGLGGEISALAWDDPKPAQVRLEGRLDGGAPLQLAGTIHPLGARLHTDLQAEVRGIDLTRLSTYSSRYAGYGIEKGTLSARLRYRVDDGRLQAENNLRLDQLTFGDKVESPDALKLPVLLAVSLLKDRNGVIDIDLPIGGSLDDPKFSVGRIIVRVIVNLIEKVITAPFAALASAIGGGKQELSFIAFAPGSSTIDAAARSALDTLGKALVERPGLRLEITGRVDPAVDTAALHDAQFERLLRSTKAQATREPLDQVRVPPEERARWIEAAWRAQQGSGLKALAARLREAPPPAEMEAALRAAVPAVGPAQLQALADARADAVKAALAAQVAPERLLVTASRLDAAGLNDAGKATRVAFALK